MRPLTSGRPKVMLPLAGKPVMEHLLVNAAQAGIRDFIFIVGYRDEIIRQYFGNGERWGVDISYISQKKQAGTGDAVRMAAPLVNGDFLVLNGDILTTAEDLRSLASGNGIIMAVFPAKDVTRLGIVETDGDRLIRIHEKSADPPGNLANTGMYRFTADIFDAVKATGKSPRGEYEITATLNSLAQSPGVTCFGVSSWRDISYPWDMLEANEILMSGLTPCNDGTIEQYASVIGPVSIGDGSTIRSGSYIEGPVIIGSNCDIGPNCFIRPGTVIGDNCHIGAAVEIKNSIIMNGTKIPHHNYVGDCVIGENCNFGSGTKVANLRLDKKSIIAGGIDTGRRKLGAIIGDNVSTGINSCINVGTVIGNDVFIGPGAVANGNIKPGTSVF